ncbi:MULTISPECIES: DUF6587 family protein [Acinetobacter]|uniref:Uncharacterized protein n=1 Tax=Acinetobacter piscicola TaxID=2006115 RepID=A0A7S6VTR1_9GAMM|nr:MULTISPECIES: DUF6587 family protein [Acinetobacter]QOW44753.1 hypothetical protein G0028_01895 [Acinetobacter piscicola]
MVELLMITALVIWSAIFVFKKVFPKSAYSVFSKLAQLCRSRGWNGLAKWLQPAMVTGCGGGCGCSSSDAPAQKKVEVQAVKWK